VRHVPNTPVGPRTPRDALGGDVMGAASVKLLTPLRGQFADYGVQAQAFASVGGLQSIGGFNASFDRGCGGLPTGSSGGGFLRGVRTAASDMMRAVIGVGIGMPTQLGRLEVNLTHVLKKQPTDSFQKSGWQVGVSGSLS